MLHFYGSPFPNKLDNEVLTELFWAIRGCYRDQDIVSFLFKMVLLKDDKS